MGYVNNEYMLAAKWDLQSFDRSQLSFQTHFEILCHLCTTLPSVITIIILLL